MTDGAAFFLVGGAFLFGWVFLIVVSALRVVRIFPRMPPSMTGILVLAIAATSFIGFFYLYAIVLAASIVVSGFVGGLGIGLVRLRGVLAEGTHLVMAVFAMAMEVLL